VNYLKNKTVYLCGPIAAVKDDGIGWRKEITPRLNDFGVKVLDPCKKSTNDFDDKNEFGEVGKDKEKFRKLILKEDWKGVKEKFWPIIRYDLRCVDHCDFVIFYYDPLVSMCGSIHELVVATFEKKNILLYYKKEQLEHFNPWVATFIKENHFFDSWDVMFDYLKNVNDGKFDTSLWVI